MDADPLARQMLDRLLVRRDLQLRGLIEDIGPPALASRSVEALAVTVLEAVVPAPLVPDMTTLDGPERTSGGWIWAVALDGGHDLAACLPSRWLVLPRDDPSGTDDRLYLVFYYIADGATIDDTWVLFQRDWRDALAWIAYANAVVAQATRRWRAVASARIARRASGAGAGADADIGGKPLDR